MAFVNVCYCFSSTFLTPSSPPPSSHTHTPKNRGTQPGPSIIYKGKVIKQMQSGGGKKSPKAAQGGPTATAGGQMEEAHCKCSGAHA